MALEDILSAEEIAILNNADEEETGEKPFVLTPLQQKIWDEGFCDPNVMQVLLYGGSQSGKTLVTLYYQTTFCLNHKMPSMHVASRMHFSDVISSTIVTFENMLKLRFGEDIAADKSFCHVSKSSPASAKFYNGSIIWFLGLDDRTLSSRGDKNLGKTLSTVFIDEASEVSYSLYEKMITRLSSKSGKGNKVIIGLNPSANDHWTHDMFLKGVNPVSKKPLDMSIKRVFQVNPRDNLKNISKVELTLMSEMSDEKIKRFIFGEYSDYQLKDAIYGKQLQQAYNEHRISKTVTYDPTVPLVAVGDIGWEDYNAFWTVQFLPSKIVLVDFEQCNHTSMGEMVKRYAMKPYRISRMYLPFDSKQRRVADGHSTFEITAAYAMRLPPQKRFGVIALPKESSVRDGIEFVRSYFPRIYINSEYCEAGITSLKAYKFPFNEITNDYGDNPGPKWASHACDALRYVLMAYHPAESKEREQWRGNSDQVFGVDVLPPSLKNLFGDDYDF